MSTVVDDVVPFSQVVAAASQDTFNYGWWIREATDLVVFLDDMIVDGTDYSVTNLQTTTGGQVIFNLPLTGGQVVTITTAFPFSRLSGFATSGSLRAAALNMELSYLVACILQLQRDLQRALKLSPSSTTNPLNLVLPVPQDDRVLAWDGNAGAMKNGPSTLDLIAAGGYAQQAIEAAAEAAISEQNAIAAALALQSQLDFVASPLPFLSARALGFDHSGVLATNAAKLQALLNDNVNYPRGFILLLDKPGGKYRFGDATVDDNGKTYQVWGLGGGPAGAAPTEILMNIDATQRDHVRVRANDVKWLNVSINGETTTTPTYTPSFFVKGYAGGTGGAARNFALTGTVWNTPGKVIDDVQGVHCIIDVRGGGGWGPFIYGRGPGSTGNYKGGNDQQNYQLNFHFSSWKNWVIDSEVGSSNGSHNFIFAKYYSCYNGIRIRAGGNNGYIYCERTSQDWSGVPWYCEGGNNFIQFQGALDDSDWLVNDYNTTDGNGLAGEYARTGRPTSVYLSTQDGFGLLYNYLPTMLLTIYKRAYAGSLNFEQTAPRVTTISIKNTSITGDVVVEHEQRASNQFVRWFMDKLGFRSNYDDATRYFLAGFQRAIVPVTHLNTISDTIGAHGNFQRTVTVSTAAAIGNIKLGDILHVAPRFVLPAGIIYRAYAIADGQVEIRIYNTTASPISGPITGDWTVQALNVTT